LTFKDLKTQLSKLQPSAEDLRVFERLRNKPFWIWDQEQHRKEDIKTNGDCCFNHIIGLPVKNGKEYPFFDYEELIFNTIEANQNIWIKKARGLGVTTFLIRYLAWKILTSSQLDGQSIFIISGTREEFANYVKKKMEQLFERRFPDLVLDSKYTELMLKKTWIKVMPTKNIKDVRGYMDAAYLFIDEADYFDKKEQEELEPAIMAYEEKSKGKTIMVSTPNAPDGLFEGIEKDKNSKYKKLFLDYTYGLDKIYDREYIARKKLEPEFEREYNLKYLGKIGNVFNIREIDLAIEMGKNYDPNKNNEMCQKSIGIDPAFGSSAFGIVVTQWQDQQIQILHADEYQRPDFNEMLDLFWSLYERYHPVNKIYIDGANPSFIKSLKIMLGDRSNYETVPKERWRYMKVQSVNFATRHKAMLGHSKLLLEKGYIAINDKFDKLITSLRTAVATENTLDKEATSYNDIFDSFRLALEYYQARGYQSSETSSEKDDDSISNSEVKI
jgi:hypothetical protein